MPTGASLIDFCIGLIVLLVIVFLIYKALDFLAPGPEIATIAKYVVGALAIIVLLLLAKAAIFGGGLSLWGRHADMVPAINRVMLPITVLQPPTFPTGT